MSYKYVLYERQRKGALMPLNRPKPMNAFNGGLRRDLHAALKEADYDPIPRSERSSSPSRPKPLRVV